MTIMSTSEKLLLQGRKMCDLGGDPHPHRYHCQLQNHHNYHQDHHEQICKIMISGEKNV